VSIKKVSTRRWKAESRGAQKLDRLGESCDDRVWFELREKSARPTFLGYDTEKAEGVITALVADGKLVTEPSKARKSPLC